MSIELINPTTGRPLRQDKAGLRDEEGGLFPIVRGVPRVCDQSNYTESFGKQWNLFKTTQIDRADAATGFSEQRFFSETGWTPAELAGQDILEVGSGAGRFSEVVLRKTEARLWSVDYSSAVEANLANNGAIAPDRFRLFQASIYEMPFADDSFDKVFCMGVLQHTPDFEASVRALINKAKPGGEIVVDFYEVRGFWTKLNAKYLLRPVSKRVKHDRLLGLIERNVDWMVKLSRGMSSVGLAGMTRFLPLVDLRTFPKDLSPAELREWAVLDTFDMFSPEYDNPQRIRDVARMFERSGAEVTFAGNVDTGHGLAAVVRGRKRAS
jgi:SAM-dependent methyltransferase